MSCKRKKELKKKKENLRGSSKFKVQKLKKKRKENLRGSSKLKVQELKEKERKKELKKKERKPKTHPLNCEDGAPAEKNNPRPRFRKQKRTWESAEESEEADLKIGLYIRRGKPKTQV